MSRRVGTALEVKCAHGDPEQFLWCDRLYRVDQVLQRWERSADWWRQVHAEPSGRDLRIWRVEASAGRHAGQGVYDLSFDPAADRWYLIRTFD